MISSYSKTLSILSLGLFVTAPPLFSSDADALETHSVSFSHISSRTTPVEPVVTPAEEDVFATESRLASNSELGIPPESLPPFGTIEDELELFRLDEVVKLSESRGTMEAMEATSESVSKSKSSALTESVIGPDQRVRIRHTTQWPWTVQGKVTMIFPSGGRYIGSGTLINKHHVLTAGHVIYSHDDGGWATSVSFAPGQDDRSQPFGVSMATRLLSVKGWTEQRNPDYDMGMIILNQDIGDQTGYFGIITGPESVFQNYRVNVTGYPGDKPDDRPTGREMHTMSDAIKRVGAEEFGYFIDTFGGQSGSGVWSHWEPHEGYHCAGIHVRGTGGWRDPNDNDATRLTKPKFDRIVEWLSTY